jgi:hypothetical protein
MNNLVVIARSVELYRSENQGQAPPSLTAMLADGYPTERHLRCMASSRFLGEVSYVYIRPWPNPPEKTVIAFELPVSHRNKYAARVFADAKVESEDLPALAAALQATNNDHATMRQEGARP